MTTTNDLLTMTVAALKGKTSVMDNVYTPRDWPTWNGNYPLILIQAPREDKTSLGRNTPQFTVVTTIKITARVQAIPTERDGGAALAESRLLDLKSQIEMALINSYELTKRIQQFLSVNSEIDVSAEGENHIGELVITVAMEFYQGPEDFYSVELNPLTEVTVTVEEPDGTVEPAIDLHIPQ